MGGSHSVESVKRSSGVDTNFDTEIQKWLESPEDRFFVNLRAPNLLQVIDAPREILQYLLRVLGSDARSVRPIWRPNAYEIELDGSPLTDHHQPAVSSTTTKGSSTAIKDDAPTVVVEPTSIETSFCRLLAFLHEQNWHPYISMNLSPFCDRSTCYFRRMIRTPILILPDEPPNKSASSSVAVSVSFISQYGISMNTSDDQQDEDAHVLDTVEALIREAVDYCSHILRLEKKECTSRSIGDGSRRLTVPYNLWKCVSVPDSIFNRLLILDLIKRLEHDGYRLSTCVDFRGSGDTLFFVKPSADSGSSPLLHTGVGGGGHTYCMLSANSWDILRLYEAPRDLVDVTRLLLGQHWPQGVETEVSNANYHEFQFGSFPWAARAADAAQSYSMFATLLQTYLARGWRPLAAVQTTRTFKDRSCVILRKEKPSYRPHMCLGLLDSNELHLINADEELRDYVHDLVCTPTAPTSVNKNQRRSLAAAKINNNAKGGWPSLTLRGDPWCTVSLANTVHNHHQRPPSANSNSTNNNNENGQQQKECRKPSDYDYLEARAFVQKLLAALRFRGWDTVINLDLAARVKYKRKMSTTSGGSTNNSFKQKSSTNNNNNTEVTGEESMPLDVNSLILANVNGSRHNSIVRSTTSGDPLQIVFRAHSISID